MIEMVKEEIIKETQKFSFVEISILIFDLEERINDG